jgi:hypothetical protein
MKNNNNEECGINETTYNIITIPCLINSRP